MPRSTPPKSLNRSNAQMGNTNALGHRHSLESRERMSASKKWLARRKVHPLKGRISPFKGLKHTDEAKAAMSQKRKAGWSSRPKYLCSTCNATVDGGNYIRFHANGRCKANLHKA
jgi:hypothetical protein